MKALKIKRSICAVVSLGLFIFTFPTLAQKPDVRFDPVRKKIEDLLVTGKIPAISVGVAQDGKMIWEEGFGFADLEKKRHARADTIYNIGSTSKPITATAVMMLAEQDKIRLDIPANNYLPDGSPLQNPFSNTRNATVRQLLNHTSGLSRHSQMFTGNETGQLQPEETPGYKATGQYTGHWKGKIKTWKEEIPVEMWFKEDGDIHIQLKGQYRNLLNGVRFEEGYLRGSFGSDIGTSDANRHRYNLHLKLKLREDGNALGGSVTSSSIDPAGNVLSSWIALEKQK
jgi:hypothetical protein